MKLHDKQGHDVIRQNEVCPGLADKSDRRTVKVYVWFGSLAALKHRINSMSAIECKADVDFDSPSIRFVSESSAPFYFFEKK